jgi:hypothetical protein
VKLDRSKLAKARRLLSSSNADQLALGRLLVGVKAEGNFAEFCQAVPVHTRKAYCLIEVAIAVDAGRISAGDVSSLGWTKAYAIAARAKTKAHAQKARSYASNHSVVELQAFLAGGAPTDYVVRVFRLSLDDAAALDRSLLSFGAVQTSRGIVDRESALLKILRTALSSVKLKIAA